jgi:hypothetical protein
MSRRQRSLQPDLRQDCSALLIIGGVVRGVPMPASDEDQVIVLRFWAEDESAELHSSRHWRARITYVNTGQQFYVPSLDEAFAVVSSLILRGKYPN